MKKLTSSAAVLLMLMGTTAACGSAGCDDYVQADDCGEDDD